MTIDTPHFRQYLGNREWAFFTDLSETSLLAVLGQIVDRYEAASAAAVRDFQQEFNYEKVFVPVLERVIAALPPAQHAR